MREEGERNRSRKPQYSRTRSTDEGSVAAVEFLSAHGYIKGIIVCSLTCHVLSIYIYIRAYVLRICAKIKYTHEGSMEGRRTADGSSSSIEVLRW